MSLNGYDTWKLATPPEYELDGIEQGECKGCGAMDNLHPSYGICFECLADGPDPDTAPGGHDDI